MSEYGLNTRGSAWIMANAGSGKTYVLARRVVRLLLEDARPESIVCLTYTKAAASEMRDRILALLKILTIAQGDALTSELTGMLGETPSDTHISRAPALLNEVLDSPVGGMQITTIHGFCQQLLGSFPLEAGISPHATLMDDREQAELIHQTIRRVYAGDDRQLNESLGLITEITAEGRLNDWLSSIIRGRRDWAAVNFYRTHEDMRAAIIAVHPAIASYSRDYWVEALASGVPEEMRAVAMLLSELGNENQQKPHAATILKWLAAPAEMRQATIADYRDALLVWKKDECEIKPRSTLITKKVFAGKESLEQALLREQQRALEIAQAMSILSAIEETYHVAVLARGALQLYTQAKLSRSALDYDDLVDHIESLFARELPWVMTKLDYRIDHLLLDEAQDTSPAQWRISEALVKELLTVEAPSGQARSLFVVGDEKQSIYSFQGAAPEMFAKMREDWREVALIEPFTLAKSYRSVQPILSLADAMCSDRQVAGGDVTHQLHRAGEAGKVEIWPVVDQPGREEVEAYHIPAGYSDEERGQAILALQIAGTIHSWLEEKRVLTARGRPIRAGDIMVLVHHRKPMTPLLIRELQKLDIPVAGIDRLALASHLAVRDMVALMRWVYAPEDDLALAQILRSPLIGFSEKQLYDVAQNRGEASLWQQVKSHEDLQRWREMRHKTPYSFLHCLLEIEGKRKIYAKRFGHEIHEVLDELLQHAAQAEAGEAISLFMYAEQLEQAGKEIKRELTGGAEHDQVRVMTVHGAKGLESPVVILADTTNPPDLRKELWFHTEKSALPVVAISDEARCVPIMAAARDIRRQALQREYERLLYVAITRAEDELYITGVQPAINRKVGERSWYAICQAALKSLTGVVEDSGSYSLFTPQTAPIRIEKHKPELLKSELPAWANAPAKTEVKLGHFSPSRLVNAELALYDKTEGDARSRGVILHQLFELSTGTTDKALLAKLIRFIAPEWNEAAQAPAVDDVHGLLTHPEFAWIWSAQGYNEISLAGSIEAGGEKRWMNGQIDRLVMAGNQIVILDYKTSINVPKDASETKLSYILQMKAYRELLANKYNGKTIRCALLWTALPRLDWLDEAIDAVSWDDIAQAA